MGARHRERSTPHSRGTYTRFSRVLNKYTDNVVRECVNSGWCDDTTGSPTVDHAFHLEQTTVEPSLMTRTLDSGGSSAIVRYDGFAPSCAVSWTIGPSLQASNVAPATALAQMNPSSPVVDLPVFLYELKDIPQMWREAAKGAKQYHKDTHHPDGTKRPAPAGYIKQALIKHGSDPVEASKMFLGIKFGWGPLLSDLADFTGISPQVEKRVRQLAGRPTLYRRCSKRTSSDTSTAAVSYNTTGVITGPGTRVRVRNATSWYTSRWSSTFQPSNAHLNDLSDRVRQAMLGLEVSSSTFYEMMPWSWLVDWFVDVGSLLDVHRNIAGYTPTSLCYMETSSVEETIWPDQNNNWQGCVVGPVRWKRESKTRTLPGYSNPFSGVPVLSANQLTTLASLKVSRGVQGGLLK